MASNVALESGQIDSPLSAFSSPSQASEASSAATDRVFFGPLRSPEKRFARRAGSAPFRTPVRRSTRLSSAMVSLPPFPHQRAADQHPSASSSRGGSPDEDGVDDEPSVVLASRVLSASGNPSPPPSPPIPPQPGPSVYMDVQLLDVEDTPQPPNMPTIATLDDHLGPLIPIEGVPEPIAMSSPVTSRPSSPTPLQHDSADTSQPDLIAFDSFSASDNVTSTFHLPQDREALPGDSRAATVDDLLSLSPHPAATEPLKTLQVETSDQTTSAQPQDETTAPEAEEMEVENSLTIEADAPVASTVNPDVVPFKEGEDPTTETPRESTPPLRRSTRPRKSRNSLPQTVVTPPQVPQAKNNDEHGEETTDPASDHEQLDLQPSPARKRKLKPLPQRDVQNIGGIIDITTPRRMPQAILARSDLPDLSPSSTAVLTQLLPKPAGQSASRSTTPQPQEGNPTGTSEAANVPGTPPQQAIDFVFPQVGLQGDGEAGIQRARSPLRPFPPSPLKFDDARTPARRVPISQAIAEGTYSAQKLPALFAAPRPTAAPGSPVFKRLALDDLPRSPARRVPMNEAVPVPPPSPGKGKGVARAASPVRAAPRERQRSGSAEPRPQLGRKERGASAEPTTRPPALGRRPLFLKPAASDGVSVPTFRPALPFPLVQPQRLHPAIPEGEEPGPSTVRQPAVTTAPVQAKASPAKASSLRQPSAGAGSKIPRIGAKPYARPKASSKLEAGTSKLPTPAKSKPPPTKPFRTVKVGSSSGSSSDEGTNAVQPANKPAFRQVITPAPAVPEAPSAHGLKRKRDPEPPKQAAASAPPPVIVMRKVTPGMFSKGDKGAQISSTAAEQSQLRAPPASPAKTLGPIRARSAVNWKRPQPEGTPVPPPSSPVPPVQKAVKAPSPEPVPASVPVPSLISKPPPPTFPVLQPEIVKETREVTPPLAPASAAAPTTASGEPTKDVTAPGPSAVPEPAEEKPSRHRRSTRSKRPQEHTAHSDVFGPSVAAPSTRPLHTRRKPGPFPSETAGPFAGMSALALKTLTSANTLKNQQQLAVLTTEVVHKEGARPDSPTTKVRSALERQREERVQQRKERAERRARRSAGDEGGGLQLGEGEGGVEGVEGVEGVGDVSFMSVDLDAEGAPLRHRRGPGDEEDYETPPRPERPTKRARVEGEDADGGGEDAVQERRVKWDKGLHTMVYLDDSPPKPRRNKDAVPTYKGCLTPAAKALRLDTLGNVLNAELPVSGLVREEIVVKKFVFEDDPDAESEAVPSPAPVKSTRSKSKKAKA
ncbi:hypothetical protein C8Q79DRAFT_1118069 [Trametes meyenii]|nr:hypothetical protein C8Q79DRAFT_1118069 [Trametes meyenii]